VSELGAAEILDWLENQLWDGWRLEYDGDVFLLCQPGDSVQYCASTLEAVVYKSLAAARERIAELEGEK
jgi:hypothetical protein